MQGISREGAGESLVGWRKRGNFAASEVMRRASGTDDTNAGRGKMAIKERIYGKRN
jgi:hypothetical protein